MVPVAILFFAMAASMFGAFELSLPTGLQTRLSSVGGKGFGGAFLMGLVGGLIAAPCTGPALASVLAFVATTRSIAVGASLLFTYALGMGVLFFVIAGFSVSLPKSGAWMDRVKSFFGAVMVVAGFYFLRNVFGPLRDYGSRGNGFIAVHVGLIAVGAALLLRSTGVRKAAGVVALVIGAFGGIGSALAGSSELHWNHGAELTLARAKEQQKPALLDFYADWCLPCQELELKTFSDPKVSRLLSERELGKVDCTHDDDSVAAAAKQKFQAETLPTLVLLRADGTVAHKIDHFVGPDELAKLLDDGT
jgi:thiol:disulfide interchange protein DsbD